MGGVPHWEESHTGKSYALGEVTPRKSYALGGATHWKERTGRSYAMGGVTPWEELPLRRVMHWEEHWKELHTGTRELRTGRRELHTGRRKLRTGRSYTLERVTYWKELQMEKDKNRGQLQLQTAKEEKTV